MHGISNLDTHLHLLRNNSLVHLTTIIEMWRFGQITIGMRKGWRALRNSVLSSPTHPPEIALPRRVCVRLNHLCTSVTRFPSSLHKWGVAASAACEWCGGNQSVEHIVFKCPIHRPRHGLYGLTVLNDEIIDWLLNTCPEI